MSFLYQEFQLPADFTGLQWNIQVPFVNNFLLQIISLSWRSLFSHTSYCPYSLCHTQPTYGTVVPWEQQLTFAFSRTWSDNHACRTPVEKQKVTSLSWLRCKQCDYNHSITRRRVCYTNSCTFFPSLSFSRISFQSLLFVRYITIYPYLPWPVSVNMPQYVSTGKEQRKISALLPRYS